MNRKLTQFLLFLSVVVIAICTPFSAFAAVNQAAFDTVNDSEGYTQVCPDLHYILDDSLPYQLLMPGSNNYVSSGGFLNYSDYDLIFVQTSGQPLAHFVGAPNIDIAGDNKTISLYGCHFGDDTWTELLYRANQSSIWISNNQSEPWFDYILASNYDPLNTYNKVVGDYDDYLYYLNLSEDNYSTIDYNGYLSKTNVYMVGVKMISHVFVRNYLLPFLNMIVNEPILFLIVIVGFIIGIISFLITLFSRLTTKHRSRRRV